MYNHCQLRALESPPQPWLMIWCVKTFVGVVVFSVNYCHISFEMLPHQGAYWMLPLTSLASMTSLRLISLKLRIDMCNTQSTFILRWEKIYLSSQRNRVNIFRVQEPATPSGHTCKIKSWWSYGNQIGVRIWKYGKKYLHSIFSLTEIGSPGIRIHLNRKRQTGRKKGGCRLAAYCMMGQ